MEALLVKAFYVDNHINSFGVIVELLCSSMYLVGREAFVVLSERRSRDMIAMMPQVRERDLRTINPDPVPGSLPPKVLKPLKDHFGDTTTHSVKFDADAATNTGIRWALLNGQWTLGVRSASELARATRSYTMVGLSQDIKTPCLVMDAENDHFLKGQPELLRRTLTCENEFVSLRAEEGADTHCHEGAFFRTHQVIFDYLAKRIKENDA